MLFNTNAATRQLSELAAVLLVLLGLVVTQVNAQNGANDGRTTANSKTTITPPIAGWPIAINPGDPKFVMAASGNDLIVSRDGGLTWTDATAFYGPGCMSSIDRLVITKVRPRVFLHGCTGFLYSDDLGETWAPLPLPDQGTAYSLFPNPDNPEEFVVRSGSYLARTTDFGTTWEQSYELATQPYYEFMVDWRSRTYFRWQSSAIERRTIESQPMSWESARGGLPGTCCVHLAGGGTALFAITGSGFFRSPDLGSHWIDTGLPALGFQNSTSDIARGSIDIGAPESAVIYAWIDAPRAVFRSTDGGVSWSPLPTDAGTSGGFPQSWVQDLPRSSC